jgi:hypothetical protein
LSAVHTPGVVDKLHDSQAPPQARSQQVPATHTLDWQSSFARQAPPLGFLPHEPARHIAGGTHSPSPAQAVKHLSPLHWKGAQTLESPGVHAPLPSQVETAWWTAALQLSGAHSVPDG